MSIVFDTEALLAFYLGEAGGRKVEKYLARVMKGELEGYLNIIYLCYISEDITLLRNY